MKGILKAAKIANGRDRSCGTCPSKVSNKICNLTIMGICKTQFIKGFEKGAKWHKEHLWHPASETPKQNTLLLIHLSNGELVQGKFEGWGYSFSVPEEKLLDKVEVVRWLYLKDIL